MKVRGFKNAILILMVGLYIPHIDEQEHFSKVTSDFESWNSIRLKTKFNKKFTASFEQGMRLSNKASMLDQALSEVFFCVQKN